jgi:hypothetical protein
MLEFRTERSIFRMTDNYSRSYHTTSDGQNIEDSIVLYEYRIEYRDEKKQKLFHIKFVSEYENIVLAWMNHRFNSEEFKSFNPRQVGKLEFMTSQFDKNVLENCLRLKEWMKSDDFFGKNLLYFSDEINQTSSFFQILEFMEYEDGKLLYLKRGVKSLDETSIKISAYRHLLEWNPINKTLKLTKLEIQSGQTYARNSKVVFDLSYNQDSKYFRLMNPDWQPDKKIRAQWKEYINSVIKDTTISQEITDLFDANYTSR